MILANLAVQQWTATENSFMDTVTGEYDLVFMLSKSNADFCSTCSQNGIKVKKTTSRNI